MKHRVGDVVWCRGQGKVAIVELGDGVAETVSVQRTVWNSSTPSQRSYNIVVNRVSLSDLSEFMASCPICGRSVLTENGLAARHVHKSGDCYGSFLPMR
jgi:hypothetical protein